MRSSPLIDEHFARVRTIRRHRRALLLSIGVIAALGLVTLLAAVYVSPPSGGGKPPASSSAFARITGGSGGATGVAVSDSVLITDARTFARVGDTVAVMFFGGSQFPALVANVTQESDSSGVASLKLVAGALSPKSLIIGSLTEASTAIVVCLPSSGEWMQLRLDPANLEEPSTLGWVIGGCEGGGAVVLDRDDNIVGMFASVRGPRPGLKLLPAAALPR